jgi:hypothetical protein
MFVNKIFKLSLGLIQSELKCAHVVLLLFVFVHDLLVLKI